MPWITSSANGNVFEVHKPGLVAFYEAQGHKVSDTDPRKVKPRVGRPRKVDESD